jgi:transcriptional regulator with XRE-family HTH domain
MTEKSLSSEVGERLRGLRKERGITQEELAHLSSLHPTYIGKLERGEKNATIETIERVANALGISLEKLFSSKEPTQVQQNELPLLLSEKLNGISSEGQTIILKMVELMLEWRKVISTKSES